MPGLPSQCDGAGRFGALHHARLRSRGLYRSLEAACLHILPRRKIR